MSMNILICGVGGQGTILASKLIASAAMIGGKKVHSAETIGMAQRGGSVTSHIRIGEDVFSPLIPKRSADVLLAFEPAEAVRNLDYLKADGIVITNSVPVKPVTASLCDTGYDGKEMIEYLEKKCKCIVVNSTDFCEEFASERYFNVGITGLAVGTGCLGIKEEDLIEAIHQKVNQKFVETNIKVFHKGVKVANEIK